jgi:hypothetical protein
MVSADTSGTKILVRLNVFILDRPPSTCCRLALGDASILSLTRFRYAVFLQIRKPTILGFSWSSTQGGPHPSVKKRVGGALVGRSAVS